ncbi:PP2C family protein-serine/threonine phosphatase [Streptomyces sp. NPDC060194]|uniref:PP2C family protein-serine/threonine phosphatase n=1 Tax=Streptomyces sp. NPDC060194 TaxID=3347069 RepID=UPI0036467BF9
MPPPVFADRPAPPPEQGPVDALISRTRRLRTDVDAVRREAEDEAGGAAQGRWHQALCELAVRQLDDVNAHLDQLRDAAPAAGDARGATVPQASDSPTPTGSLLGRVGSAEWNLLTDEATWSPELYRILGRPLGSVPMTLDELPTLVHLEDQPLLTSRVTNCLIDGHPIDVEFRVVRSDGTARTVHMMGEPVLGADGGIASMWAVLRDVSELRRTERTVRETGEDLQEHRRAGQERIVPQEPEAVLPPWRDAHGLPQGADGSLELAARYLPSPTGAALGGSWYDALELCDGELLLSVGELTGHEASTASGTAMLLGALRGMAVAGARPGPLMGLLNQMLDASARPALGGAVCARYSPATRVLCWAQAGHPAPLLFRDGVGRTLTPPDGVPLGAAPGAVYAQAEERLRPGDLLVLYTDGLAPRREANRRLLALARPLTAARSAQDGVRVVAEEFGTPARDGDASVLVVRVGW